MAKMVLPWFGGSSAVWTTCMLFFQVVLLAGYTCAHWLNGQRARFAQAGVLSALLLASLVALPVVPNAAWKPSGTENPSWPLAVFPALQHEPVAASLVYQIAQQGDALQTVRAFAP